MVPKRNTDRLDIGAPHMSENEFVFMGFMGSMVVKKLGAVDQRPRQIEQNRGAFCLA